MKTIYSTTRGNFQNPTISYFATREEAYKDVNWVYGFNSYDRVIIEKLVLTDDNKIEVYECFNDNDGLQAYSEYNAEKEVFEFDGEEQEPVDFFLESDDNYTLGSGEPTIVYEEGDDEYEDLLSEF